MKKLLLLVGLAVFVAPSLVNADESDLLNSHCIESINQVDLKVGDQIGENDGGWLNVTKQCDVGDIGAMKEMVGSSLSIQNNKVKFLGVIGRIKNNEININGMQLGKLKGTIKKNKATLKFSSIQLPFSMKKKERRKMEKILSECTLEFVKDDQVQQIQQETNKFSKWPNGTYCFCVNPQKNASHLKINSNYRSNICETNSKEISYGLYLQLGGKAKHGNNSIPLKTDASKLIITSKKGIDEWATRYQLNKTKVENENKKKQQQYEEEQAKIGQQRIEQQERILGRRLDSSEKSCILHKSFGESTYKPSECLQGSSGYIYVQNLERWNAYVLDLKNNPPKACLGHEDYTSIAKKCKVELNYSAIEERRKHGCSIRLSEDELSYQCKKINTKERCLRLVTKKMENKNNCKKLTRKDFGIGKKYPKQYEELAISLGCGIERKDVDDCVRRYLPSIIGSGPMTIEQVNLIKQEWGMMEEITFGIEQMKRAQDESHQPTEEEQRLARSDQGYYAEQSNGEWMWVDTRSGYEKFTDRFCINCTSAQVYMINRATKRYFQGAPLSGFDKFILRGTNTSKVIKFYK